MGSILVLRLTTMILTAYLFTATTSHNGLIYALKWILKPFGRVGFPVAEFSLMVSLSLRFIPILLNEADRVFKALTAKGVRLETFRDRINALPLFLSPIFTNTFRRAEELSKAMLLRGYKPE